MRAIKFFSATVVLGLLCGASYANNETMLTGTLKKIKSSGKIVLGVRDASVPFSFIDKQQNYQGYSVDICLKIVDSIKKQLDMPNLKIVMNPVAAATRIPLTTNGTIDIECGSTSNNLERQKQVAFGPTTFISGTRILARKSSDIAGLEDLRGKTLVSSSSSTVLKQIVRLNDEKNLGIKIITSKDMSEGFLMVETGRAAAFAMDDILLAGLTANSTTPDDYAITREAITLEPYAIMMRKKDPAFKKVVDDAVKNLFKSGEINALYSKWFISPIPPKGVNLNWPMQDNLKEAIANPTDSGDPSTYSTARGNMPTTANSAGTLRANLK